MNVRGGSRKGRLGAGKEDQWFEPVQEKGKLWFQNCKKTTGIPSPFSQRCDDNSRKKKKEYLVKTECTWLEKKKMKWNSFSFWNLRFVKKSSCWDLKDLFTKGLCDQSVKNDKCYLFAVILYKKKQQKKQIGHIGFKEKLLLNRNTCKNFMD